MSRIDKLIEKLCSPGSTITFQELEYILGKLGYVKKKSGKTSGSRIAYINTDTKHILRLHKPHPGNELKKYVKNYIIVELKRINAI